MNGARQSCLVAAREIRERGRSRAFLASLLLMLLAVAAAVALPALLDTGPGTKDVGLTGCPGSLHGQLGWIRTRARDWFNHMERLVSPSGNIDSVRVDGSTVEVSGWARDPDATEPAIVHVVLAGRLNEAHANGYRPDIGKAHPGYGDNLGWGAGFWGVPEGTHRLCVTVINQGVGGGNRLLGCRDVVVK